MALKDIMETRAWTIGLIWTFFLSFYVIGIVSIYLIVTLNIPAIVAVILVCILQALIAKPFPPYVNLLKTVMKPTKFFKKYQVIYETSNLPENRMMFAYAPHSVYSLGIIMSMNYDERPLSKSTHLGSRFILNSPLHGLLMQYWGVESVDSKHMNKLMDEKRNIALVPGGYEQATLTTPNALRLFIKKRKGFIKMALKKGYAVVPVIVLGQHQMYNTVDRFTKFRLFLNKFKMPAVIHYNKYGLLPDPNTEITVVVGTPLQMPTIENPSKDELNYWHSKYIEAMLALYDKHKHLNNNVPMEIH